MSSPRRSASLALWQGHKYAVNGATSMRLKSVLSSRCSLFLSLPFFFTPFSPHFFPPFSSVAAFSPLIIFSPFWPHSSSLCISLLPNRIPLSYPLPVFSLFPLPFLLSLYFSFSSLQPFSFFCSPLFFFFSLSFLSTVISINPFCSMSRSQHAPAPSLPFRLSG